MTDDAPEKEQPEPCDHDWELVDDSFDHEYGTEQIGYYRCALCDEEKPYDSSDAHPDDC